MNFNSTSSENDEPVFTEVQPKSEPRKLNKLLIGLAVVAFGLIVTDRIMEAFRAGDVPDEASLSDSLLEGVAAQNASSEAPGDESAASAMDIETLNQLPMPGAESLVTLENLFGSPVVLVSASEPSYVVTADERRFDVGSVVDKATTLAGVTSHQLIFEQTGDLLVISLPEPVSQ